MSPFRGWSVVAAENGDSLFTEFIGIDDHNSPTLYKTPIVRGFKTDPIRALDELASNIKLASIQPSSRSPVEV